MEFNAEPDDVVTEVAEERGASGEERENTNGHAAELKNTWAEEIEPTRPTGRRRDNTVHLSLALDPSKSPPGYAPRHVELTLSRTAQRAVLKLLHASLVADEACLLDGTPVRRPADAVAWLLELIAIGLPSKVLDRLMDQVQ